MCILLAAANNSDQNQGQAEGGEDAEAAEDQPPKQQRITLGTFREVLNRLADQKTKMEALGEHADVGIIRVNCINLKNVLLPAPTTCLSDMHKLLPDLAAELFHGFMDEVQSALSRLHQSSSSVEAYVEKIQFLQEVGAQYTLRISSVCMCACCLNLGKTVPASSKQCFWNGLMAFVVVFK